MRQSRLAVVGLGALLVAGLGMTTSVRAAVPGLSDDCLKGGDIVEHNGFGVPMDATTVLTDKDTNTIIGFINHGVIAGGGSHTVNVPPGTIMGHVHCDAYNLFFPVANGGGGGVGAGAKSDLHIESLFFDPISGTYIVESIFDILAKSGILSVSVPDLWGDTNGDGVIDSADTLYAVVDLRKFLSAEFLGGSAPTFSFGEVFPIVGGTTPSLPGFEFGTLPLTFDPATGFDNPNPYTGDGVAMADHAPAVPEPAALGLLALALGGLIAVRAAKI